jgi:hypothetical protein
LATGGIDGTLRLWESATGREVGRLTGHRGHLTSVTWSADGKRLFAGAADQLIHLWDPSTAKELHRFRGHEGQNIRLALTPDGKTLASGGDDQTIRLWDVADGRELRSLKKQPGGIHALAFSPDGKVLASSHPNDSAITLWDVQTGKEVRRLEGHGNGVSSFVFSADGRTLVSGGFADAIRLWDVDTGKVLRKLVKEPAPSGATRQVTRVALSPDGKTLVSAEEDGQVLLWEVSTGQWRGELAGHQGYVMGLAVSADGRLLATAGADTTAIVWDLTGRSRPGRRPGPPSAREREALWADLGWLDGRKAFAAVCRLAEGSRQTAAFLGERLRPAHMPDPRRIARLLADLKSEQFAVRGKAMEELEKLGDAAEPFLRRALAGRPPLEVRRRVEQLLEKLEPTRTPEGLRRLRAVEVLEHAGGPEAEGVLKDLASTPWLNRSSTGAEAQPTRPRLRCFTR